MDFGKSGRSSQGRILPESCWRERVGGGGSREEWAKASRGREMLGPEHRGGTVRHVLGRETTKLRELLQEGSGR